MEAADNALTDAQAVAQFDGHHRRLTAALDKLQDEADLSAADTISALLRTLLSRGRGNALVLRTIERFGLSMPMVACTKPPQRSKGTVVAVGNLPLDPNDPELKSRSRWIKFSEWLEEPALVLPSVQNPAYSWPEVAHFTGSTVGAHADPILSPFLLESNVLGVGGMSLLNFVLWEVAWQVERSIGELLVELGAVISVPSRQFKAFGLAFDTLSLELTVDPRADQSYMLAPSFIVFEPPVEILSFDFKGHWRWHAITNPDRICVESPPGFFGKPASPQGSSFFRLRP